MGGQSLVDSGVPKSPWLRVYLVKGMWYINLYVYLDANYGYLGIIALSYIIVEILLQTSALIRNLGIKRVNEAKRVEI